MTRSDRRQWRPRVNLLREGFSCSTLTFATLFTAIERPIATSAQGAGFSYRAFGGISARKQAQCVDVDDRRSVCGLGLCACERRRWQLLAIIAYMSVFGHRRSYDKPSDDLLAARSPAYKCRSDVCKRYRLTLLRPGRRAAIASLRHRGEFGALENGVSTRWHRSRHPLWY